MSAVKTGNNSLIVNNFDLIRLIAALEVASRHVFASLKIEQTWFLTEISSFFPGVPIFFFVSGFLISKSYENNSVIREYFQNRILRIYPALIVCTFVALLSVYLTGYFNSIQLSISQVMIWIAGQISFVQFYNPDFMRGFGTGVLNGSLWTITVELQFYVLVPILYWILGIAGNNKFRQCFVLVTLGLLFVGVNIIHGVIHHSLSDVFLYKLWHVSFSPWFYMFLIGIIFQKYFEWILRVLHGKFLFILFIYIFFAYLSKKYFGWAVGYDMNPLLFLLLSFLIFSLAFSFPTMGNFILRKNDISYGVYIYHIPMVNLFIYYGYVSNISIVFLVLVLTIIIAAISWMFIEKPAMKLKRHPFNPLQQKIYS